MATEDKTTPESYLTGLVGSQVIVKLNDGLEYQGKLLAHDAKMNVALAQASEISQQGEKFPLGDCFVAGMNVYYVAAA